MDTQTTGVENSIVKTCQFCARKEQHRILPEQLMYENPDTNGACVKCEKKMLTEEKAELARITPQTIYWYPETQNRPDHIVRFWHSLTQTRVPVSTQASLPDLPELVFFRIFLMLASVCRTTEEFISICLKYMKAMEPVIPPASFIAHLRANAPKQHKKWHDFMMYQKHTTVGRQFIPECFGPICCVNTTNNPQLERVEDPVNGSRRAGDTSIGVCECSHQTMWNIDYPNISILGEDGCYSIGSIVTPNNPYGYRRHDTMMSAHRFIADLEHDYREQFMHDLHEKISKSLVDSETTVCTGYVECHLPFITTDGIKEDTHRVKGTVRVPIRVRKVKSHPKKNKRNERNQKKREMQQFCSDFALV